MVLDDAASLVETVSSPLVFVRIVESLHAEHAELHFAEYVRTTLRHNRPAGGRFNAPNEFGVLYSASDESTAWAELHARFTREGLTGLPSVMAVLLIQVSAGRLVDFNRSRVRDLWRASLAELTAHEPTDAERQACWDVGRRAREVVDFLRSPSARTGGDSIPIFVDRPHGKTLVLKLADVDLRRATPMALRQLPAENWD